MNVGELIKALADYCPDTEVATLDGNMLVSSIHGYAHGEDLIDSGPIADELRPDTLYLYTD